MDIGGARRYRLLLFGDELDRGRFRTEGSVGGNACHRLHLGGGYFALWPLGNIQTGQIGRPLLEKKVSKQKRVTTVTSLGEPLAQTNPGSCTTSLH